MASTEEDADAMDIEVSPKNRTSVEHDIHQSLGSISNSVESLEMRADPDAQATVTDFLDFTEYLPSDMTRSLTLIGKLDQTYTEASINIHNLTSTWGKLPSIPAEERPSPVQLRADISDSLNHAVSSRVYAHAEAVRMSENVNRHYNRANTILAKLKNLLENYPAEEQKSPVATSKPQLVRAPRVMRNEDGEKVRRPQIPRITVPGEVLPPYDQFVAYSDDSDESSEEEDDESLGRTPARTTPAPRIKVVKTPKARPLKTPKAASSARPPKSAAGPAAAATPAVVLQPPPENAVIGSADAPWLQLTPWELARLRKRMKKNATWSPSDTMILRELKTLGRGIDAYKEAKKKAEDEGRVFDQVPAALAPDAEAGNKPIPEGAISAAALASDDIQLSNRGMKLNEAKKLKRESLAKQAAEEAEESARQFREAARLLMSHEASSSSVANNNNNTTTPSTSNNNTANTAGDQLKGASKAKTPAKQKANGNKRKRDSIPEAEAEKPEQPPAETPAPRPAPKRTKTETPVPLPHQRASLTAQSLAEPPVPPPVLTPGGTAVTPKMTTPVPIPVPGQDGSAIGPGAAAAKPVNTSAPASSPTGSVGPPASVAGTVPASILTKPPAETPIPPPVLSPKKSTTPILPPVRDSAARRETRGEMAKKNQQQLENLTPVPAPQIPQAQRSSSAAPSIKQSSSRAATPGTTPVPDGQGRRPSSRGKAMSQEPQPSLATDRPRRASTARNTPAPEQRQQSKRTRKPVPGIVSKTNAGGSSAVGKRKAAPKKKRAQKKEKGQPIEIELEEDDEGNPIDPKEPRYCDCNRVSFGEMIACDNDTTLDHIRVPWYQAPGEAEAECALLQQKGLVDAVWSKDGDTFLFGCTVLIRNQRDEKGAKLKEDAEIFEFEKNSELQKGLVSKEGIALLGILVGLDYVTGGLKGCGISLAQHLIKKEALVDEFSRIQAEERATRWRESLEASVDDILLDKVLGLSLHFDKGKSNIKKFPDLKALRSCLSPVVSGSDALERLPFLQGEWYRIHTTETLGTSIPWMSQHYHSKLDAAGWVEKFIPTVVNQKLLKEEVGSRNLFAQICQEEQGSLNGPRQTRSS
ncbi:PHD-finger domain-containing protein [Colletotrichum salicis]|uniref:PHD-finger domain-containing protein n=1 Tax=Colletotrichum salicis TaxID=1209931 RepID=A0A135USQ1_9PEZI|nr:PHD-finger domain-containing protein [Colletotrichum salicis]